MAGWAWAGLTAVLAVAARFPYAEPFAGSVALAAPALWMLLPALAIAHGGGLWLGFARPAPAARAALETAILLAIVIVAARWAPAASVPLSAGAITFQILAIAPAEEAFFRGWLQAGLRARFGAPAAIAGSAAAFGLSHLAIQGTPAGLLTVFPGALFALARERHGTLLTPILLHAGANVAVLAWHAAT